MAEKRLEIEGLHQRLYDPARREQFVVHVDTCITLLAGDFVALLGPSGCGKTTLLSVLGLLRSPTDPGSLKRFSIWIPKSKGGTQEVQLNLAWRDGRRRLIESIRRRHIGFALQSGELISSLTVHENIAVPLRLNGIPGAEVKQRVDSLIHSFQLRRQLHAAENGNSSEPSKPVKAEPEPPPPQYSSLANAMINRLSGGEYQRVALARAVAHRPTIAFVDEPTSALNRELARGSLQLLKNLQSDQRNGESLGITVMITHDEQFAAEFSNVIIRMAPRRDEPAGEVVEVCRM